MIVSDKTLFIIGESATEAIYNFSHATTYFNILHIGSNVISTFSWERRVDPKFIIVVYIPSNFLEGIQNPPSPLVNTSPHVGIKVCPFFYYIYLWLIPSSRASPSACYHRNYII